MIDYNEVELRCVEVDYEGKQPSSELCFYEEYFLRASMRADL